MVDSYLSKGIPARDVDWVAAVRYPSTSVLTGITHVATAASIAMPILFKDIKECLATKVKSVLREIRI